MFYESIRVYEFGLYVVNVYGNVLAFSWIILAHRPSTMDVVMIRRSIGELSVFAFAPIYNVG